MDPKQPVLHQKHANKDLYMPAYGSYGKEKQGQPPTIRTHEGKSFQTHNLVLNNNLDGVWNRKKIFGK